MFYLIHNLIDKIAEPGISLDPLLVDFLVDNATALFSVKGRNKLKGGQVSLAVLPHLKIIFLT